MKELSSYLFEVVFGENILQAVLNKWVSADHGHLSRSSLVGFLFFERERARVEEGQREREVGGWGTEDPKRALS